MVSQKLINDNAAKISQFQKKANLGKSGVWTKFDIYRGSPGEIHQDPRKVWFSWLSAPLGRNTYLIEFNREKKAVAVFGKIQGGPSKEWFAINRADSSKGEVGYVNHEGDYFVALPLLDKKTENRLLDAVNKNGTKSVFAQIEFATERAFE